MSSPSQQQRQRRSSLKQTSADAMRRKMNIRRQDRQNLIRKQKKSEMLNTRRRYYYNNDESMDDSMIQEDNKNNKLSSLSMKCLQTKDSASLALFEAALATKGEDESLFVLNTTISQEARELCDYLGQVILQHDQAVDAFLACRVLTNLAAMDDQNTKTASEDDYSYYGRPSERENSTNSCSWGSIIVQSQAWSALMQVLDEYRRANNEVNPSFLPITRQACWAIGNLSLNCPSTDVIQKLVGTLQDSQSRNHVEVCQMAAWAIHMLVKNSSEYDMILLNTMSPADMIRFLNTTLQEWMEVSLQICWILAHLTSRDDDDEWMQKLLLGDGNDGMLLISAIVQSLQYSVVELQQQSLPTIPSSQQQHTIDRIIPCLRAVGNIATACQGNHVRNLIVSNNYSLATSLKTLLELGSSSTCSSDVQDMAVEAAWAAGSILCDAGVPDHPSTTSASLVLLPALCSAIDYKTSMARLELKREALSALWNMITAPPSDEQAAAVSRPKRGEFLVQITEIHGSIESLVELLQSKDFDVVYFALSLLNAILRQARTLSRQRFLFCQGVEALESICDGERQDECADMAADLIDDFFSQEILNDDHDDEEEDAAMFGASNEQQQASGQDTFSFGVSAAMMSQVFDFSQQTAAPTAFSATAKPSAVGRGRGMQAQQQQQQQQR